MRMRKATRGGPVLAALLLVTGACASAGGSGRSGSGPLTQDILLETGHTDLYTAVQVLRPQWLRARGLTSVSQPSVVLVFVNDAPFGTVDGLGQIPIDSVVDVRFLSASEAANRFGTTAGSSGAIAVSTRIN